MLDLDISLLCVFMFLYALLVSASPHIVVLEILRWRSGNCIWGSLRFTIDRTYLINGFFLFTNISVIVQIY